MALKKYSISNPSVTAALLSENKIRLKKNLGQNFLIDTNILKKIVKASAIQPEDRILEIGCGIGSLTELLIKECDFTVCLEIDRKLTNVFKNQFDKYLMDDIEDKPLRLRRHEEGPKIKLIQADAMKISYSDIYSKYKITRVVSNLPYKISAPLIIKILTEAPQIAELYLTIQKDIADRVLAGPGQKNYSSYTVKSGYLADFKLLFKISRTCFMPAPHVDSVFIKAVQKNCLPETNSGMFYTDEFKKSYFEFVDYCFIHRRKKLINSLLESKKHQILEKIDMVAGILSDFGKDTDIRAEELKPEEIFTLFIKIFKNPCIKN